MILAFVKFEARGSHVEQLCQLVDEIIDLYARVINDHVICDMYVSIYSIYNI